MLYSPSTGLYYGVGVAYAHLPTDIENRTYEQWQSDIGKCVMLETPMLEVSMRQFRDVLIEDELFDVFQLAIAKTSDSKERRKLENEFEFATTVRRDSHLTSLLTLTPAQWDDFFQRAAKVQ